MHTLFYTTSTREPRCSKLQDMFSSNPFCTCFQMKSGWHKQMHMVFGKQTPFTWWFFVHSIEDWWRYSPSWHCCWLRWGTESYELWTCEITKFNSNRCCSCTWTNITKFHCSCSMYWTEKRGFWFHVYSNRLSIFVIRINLEASASFLVRLGNDSKEHGGSCVCP